MNRETVYRGLSNAAWGYFFLHIDFNLGVNQTSVNVLPRRSEERRVGKECRL